MGTTSIRVAQTPSILFRLRQQLAADGGRLAYLSIWFNGLACGLTGYGAVGGDCANQLAIASPKVVDPSDEFAGIVGTFHAIASLEK